MNDQKYDVLSSDGRILNHDPLTVGDWLDRHKLRERFFLVRDAKLYHRVDGVVVELKGGGA